MIVTETKLTELTGYTKSEIKNRRQRHWIAGTHYVYDPAGKIVYNVEAIESWALKGYKICMGAAKLDGRKTANSAPNCSTTHTPTLVSKKPQQYV